MSREIVTSEFSICLLPDKHTSEIVDQIRSNMPASPYRDDTPHITLLRTIKTPTAMSDEEALGAIGGIVQLASMFPLHAEVAKAANRFSPLYRFSSQVIFHASPEMKSSRKRLLKTLKAEGYSVGALESHLFLPHISVRLGVAYSNTTRSTAEKMLPTGITVVFQTWSLFRVVYEDGKRMVRELRPYSSVDNAPSE